jgi:hypothetical protein
MVHWLDEPRVEVERPLWLIPRGPREAVAATRRGLDAVANGVWDVAERELRAAVAAFGDDPRTHANLAVVLERRGDRVGARAELHAAARLERGAESRFGRLLHEFNRTFLSFATGPLGRRAASQPAGAPASQPANAPAP